MRFLLTLGCTILLGWLSGLLLPFWSLSLSAMVIGFLVNPGGNRALPAGLLGGAILWGTMAWTLDMENARILSTRIGTLFGTGSNELIGLTALMGGLLAGLGTLVGDRARTSMLGTKGSGVGST